MSTWCSSSDRASSSGWWRWSWRTSNGASRRRLRPSGEAGGLRRGSSDCLNVDGDRLQPHHDILDRAPAVVGDGSTPRAGEGIRVRRRHAAVVRDPFAQVLAEDSGAAGVGGTGEALGLAGHTAILPYKQLTKQIVKQRLLRWGSSPRSPPPDTR